MARAARHNCGQAAVLGLLAAAAGACAAVRNPPGGPPDFDPPELVSVVPDSGSIQDNFSGRVEFRFDEVVSERSAGGLERLIEISPRHERLSISWRRNTIAVKPRDGWIQNTVYHVTLLKGATDLSNNVSDSSTTVTFSTGGAIPATVLSGTAVDWEQSRMAVGALVEAIHFPDSLTYTGRTDSVGNFRITALPRGDYLLLATIDGNGNRRRDRREAFDSVLVSLDSSATATLWTFAHDTTGPRLRAAAQIDSVTTRLTFNQMLAPAEPARGDMRILLLPDSQPVLVDSVMSKEAYDSLVAARRALAVTVADSLAAPDSVAVDSIAATIEETEDPQLAILSERPKLSDSWYVVTIEPLLHERRYVFVAIASNIEGAVEESRTLLVTAERAEERAEAAEPQDSL